MCNAFKELEAEWMERGIKQSNQQAIISMLEFGITKEQIITRYTKEELENAEAAMVVSTMNIYNYFSSVLITSYF